MFSVSHKRKIRKNSTYRYDEEHVRAGIKTLEPTRIVGEFVTGIRIRGVPEENALHLTWVFCGHGWVILHDIAIARVRD